MKSKYTQMLFICFVALVLLGVLLVAKPAHAANGRVSLTTEPKEEEVQGVTTFIDTQFGNVCYIVRKRAISCVSLPKE